MNSPEASQPLSFKTKTLILISTVVLILIVALTISPIFINTSKLKTELITTIQTKYQQNISINGEVKLSVNPFLDRIDFLLNDVYIPINKASSNDLLSVKALTVSFYMHSFFFGDKNISKVHFDQMSIDNKQNSSLIGITDYFKIPEFNTLKNVTFKNAKFSFHALNLKNELFNFNAQIAFKGNKKVEITTDGNIGKHKLELNATINDPLKIEENHLLLNFLENKNTVKVEGNFTLKENDIEFKGKCTAAIQTFGLVFQHIAGNSAFFDYLNNNSFSQPINITSDVELKNYYFQFSNMKFASDEVSGIGELGLDIENLNKIDINFDFSKIDLTDFNPKVDNDNNNYNTNFIDLVDDEDKNPDLFNLNFLKKNLNININIDKILNNGFKGHNVILIFNTNNGEIINSNFSYVLDGNSSNSKIQLSNFNFGNNENEPFILGTTTVETEDLKKLLTDLKLQDYVDYKNENSHFKAQADISIARDKIGLSNLNANIGSTSTIEGTVTLKNENLSNYSCNLKLFNIDFSQITFPLFYTRLKFFTETSASSYLTSFSWFRNLSATYNLNFEVYQKEPLTDIENKYFYQFNVKPGEWQTLGNIKSSEADFNFNIGVLAQAIKPNITIDLTGEHFNYDSFKNALVSQKIISNDSLSTSNEKTSNSIWSNDNFNFHNIKKNNLIINVDVNNFSLNELNFKDFKFNAHSSDDVLYFDNIYFTYFDGQFKAMGNVSLYDKTLLQLSYNTAGININDIMQNIENNIMHNVVSKDALIKGPITSSGSLVSQGSSFKEIIQNLNASINFHAPSLIVQGIDADSIVNLALKRKAFNQNEVLSSLQSFLTSGTTSINNLSGSGKIENGVLTSSDISFNSSYNNAAMALSLDLNSLEFYSNLKLAFMPYIEKTPIEYSFIFSGNLAKKLDKQSDLTTLIDFIKEEYNLQRTPSINSNDQNINSKNLNPDSNK